MPLRFDVYSAALWPGVGTLSRLAEFDHGEMPSMPGTIDGFGLAHWIRTNRPRLPIILTSGDAKKASSAKQLCESEPFMAKPYELSVVVARIRASIETTRTKED